MSIGLTLFRSLIVAGGVWMGSIAAAAAQAPVQALAPAKSFCAECHLVNSTPRSRTHILDWQRSVHAKRGVGCESCHGGDAETVDPMRAHLAIKGSEDPTSPISRGNLPDTCGKCHTRSADQFRKSRHFVLLRSGADTSAPTCSTCHGEAGATLPEADEVKAQCAQCHGIGKSAGHPEYPPAAKLVVVQYGAARLMLDGAESFIPILSDPAQRASMELDAVRATQALAAAAETTHTMDYDAIDGKLTVAFDRIVALIRRIMTTTTPVAR